MFGNIIFNGIKYICTEQVKNYWIPKEDLKRRYPQIVGFHAVSAYDGTVSKCDNSYILNCAHSDINTSKGTVRQYIFIVPG